MLGRNETEERPAQAAVLTGGFWETTLELRSERGDSEPARSDGSRAQAGRLELRGSQGNTPHGQTQ